MAHVLQRPAEGTVDAELSTRPRATWRQNAITAALGLWMLTGAASDVWAHLQRKPDTFFTLWHLITYTGTLALIIWMVSLSAPRGRGVRFPRLVPVGYGLGLVGAALSIPGGVGDGVWHTIFGIEVNLEAMGSPTHIVLFVSTLLLLSTAARATWLTARDGGPTLRALLPALLSLVATVTIVQLTFVAFSAFHTPAATMDVAPSAGGQTLDALLIEQGFTDIQLTNLLLMAPLLLTMRRWHLPFGAATILVTAPTAVMLAVRYDARGWWLLLAALAAGLTADLIGGATRRTGDGRLAHLAVALATPAVLWLSYFLVLQVSQGIIWSAELWAGSVMFAVLASYVLHLLIVQPRVPRPAEAG